MFYLNALYHRIFAISLLAVAICASVSITQSICIADLSSPDPTLLSFYHQSYGDTLLTYAAIKGQVDIIEQLLFAGADIDSTDKVFDMHYLFLYECMYIFIRE